MRTAGLLGLATLCAAAVGWVGCSNGGGGNDAGASDASTGMDVTSQQDTGAADTGSDVTEDLGPVTVMLTVMNYKSWCSVTVNGDTASTNASIIAFPPKNSVATIVAKPASTAFAIGPDPWFGIDSDDGGGAPGMDMGSGATETTTGTITLPDNRCVSVCCGDAPKDGGPVTGCPTTNPCGT